MAHGRFPQVEYLKAWILIGYPAKRTEGSKRKEYYEINQINYENQDYATAMALPHMYMGSLCPIRHTERQNQVPKWQ